MKKLARILVLVSVLSITSVSLLAQDNSANELDRRKFISVTGGVAIPLGNFASFDAKNNYAGYALSGYGFSLRGGIPFKKQRTIGICLQVDYYSNLFASHAFLKNVAAGDPTLNYTLTTSGSYTGCNIFIGSLSSIPVGKTFIDVSAQVGLSTVVFPSILVKIDDGNGNSGITGLNSTSAAAVGYGATIGWRCPIGKKLCTSATIGWFSTAPTFVATQRTIVVDTSGNWSSDTESYSFKQPVMNLSLMGGIGYMLGK